MTPQSPHRRAVGACVALGAVLLSTAVIPATIADAAPALSTVRLTASTTGHDRHGATWRSDRGVAIGGRLVKVKGKITGADRRTSGRARVGTFTYRVTVRPGVYTLRVRTVALPKKVGRGAFSVKADGAVVLRKVDALRRVGTRRSYTATATVTARSSRLVLSFAGRRGAAVTGVELLGRRPLPGRPRTPVPSKPAPTKPAPTTPAPSKPAPPTTPVPTPAPTTPAPIPTPATASVTPESFGARGDGASDDTAALQRAFDNPAGATVRLTAGRVYAYRAVLRLRTAGLRVTGAATLLALDEQRSNVWLDADRITLDGGVTVRTKQTTTRWGTFDQMGIRLGAHTGIVLRDVTVIGAAAAGVYVGGANHFVLDHVTVHDSRADGIHMTQGSAYGSVIAPTVRNSGDDGVAIVSYKSDGTPCHDITVTSPRVLGTAWGRGLSVVGGRDITETDVYVADTSAAGIYLAAEGDPWFTAAPSNVTISGGTVLRANRTTSVEHGAVLVISAVRDAVPDTLTVQGLQIKDTVFRWRQLSVITYGAPPRNVLFRDIAVTGGGSSVYGGNTPQSAYRLRNIIKDGVRLGDAG